MVTPNNLGPDLNGKAVNETQYRANPKESHLIAIKRIFSAKKQQSVAMSLAEAEYIAVAGCYANIMDEKLAH
ncbi:hypothetical protein Tco_0762891 [Tanacetum coccineum]